MIRSGSQETLSSLKTGKTAAIISISGGWGIREKLNAMGIYPGVRIRKISSMGKGGPVVMLCGRTELAIGRGMAERIMIRELDGNEKICPS